MKHDSQGISVASLARRSLAVSSIRRDETSYSPEFALRYVRTPHRSAHPPVLVIPGGPGLASVLPYRTFRSLATRGGINLIMVEHRGIGFSRRDRAGADLPFSAMRISEVLKDLVAVLDQEGIHETIIVGSSYGSYLAASFGAAYPERVSGMILDSALLSSSHIELERETVRATLLNPELPLSELITELSASGVPPRIMLDIARAGYELGGYELVTALLRSRLRSECSPSWNAMQSYATRDASIARIPGIYEFDLAGVIGFRELHYGVEPDGLPLDPALTYSPLIDRFPAFTKEPYELSQHFAEFHWPIVALSGTRDLRTPPQIAQSLVSAAPDATLVSINNGHSALDTHPLALLNSIRWLLAGNQHRLPAVAARLDQLPKKGLAARLPQLLKLGGRLGL